MSKPVPKPAVPTDALGIFSIVLAFIFPIAGLVVGIIGVSEAKKAGHSTALSQFGWILNLIFCLLYAVLFIVLIASYSAVGNLR